MVLKISCAKFGQNQPKPGWFLPPPGLPSKKILAHYVLNEKIHIGIYIYANFHGDRSNGVEVH